MVRNADALAAAGHDVVVHPLVLEQGIVAIDQKFALAATWRYRRTSVLAPATGRLRLRARLQRRALSGLLNRLSIASLGAHALVFDASRLQRDADIPADLYLAHQQACLPIVARLAAKHRAAFGCDVEDVLECADGEPQALLRSVSIR